MAEYIDRAAAVKVILRERKPTNSVAQNRMLSIIQRDLLTMCAADVAPVVRCKDCENSYEDAFGRLCAYGICADRTVPDDFYCASSKPKEGAE